MPFIEGKYASKAERYYSDPLEIENPQCVYSTKQLHTLLRDKRWGRPQIDNLRRPHDHKSKKEEGSWHLTVELSRGLDAAQRRQDCWMQRTVRRRGKRFARLHTFRARTWQSRAPVGDTAAARGRLAWPGSPRCCAIGRT